MEIGDDIYLGTAFIGGANVSAGPSPMTMGVGPLGRVYVLDMVPVASHTTISQNEICPQQNLPTGAMTVTAGTGTTAGTDPFGNAIVILPEPRNIAIYSAADLHTSTITVSGYDQYGQAMSELITCPNATTVFGKKAFKSVKSCVSSAAIASNVYVGIGTSVGLPYRVTDLGYVMSLMYNQTAITINGTNVIVADTTATATTSTGDVRGTLLLGATDGAKRLVCTFAIPALGSGPTATRIGAAGVTQA